MRLPGATRASGCSTPCPCSYGNPRLPPNRPCGVCSKSNCTRPLLLGLGGLLPTKISGRTMAEVLTIGSEETASSQFDVLNSSPFTMPHDLLWPLSPSPLAVGATDVHVWATQLDLPSEALPRLTAILSNQERERATRFRFETHRGRFIAARAVLRSILATHLDCAPDDLKFEYGPN